MSERTLAAPKSFRHGVHPSYNKESTRGNLIERLPMPSEVVLPLSQHLGAPSKSIVHVGDKVYRGQPIAEAGGFISVPLHASVTGRVSAIEPRTLPSGKVGEAIVIACDRNSAQTLYNEGPIEWEDRDVPELLAAIRDAGFVGLGGAAFPTHVKLSVPEGKHAKYFLINGAECEPYLTSDHRIMLEWAEPIILGTRIILKILGAEKAFLGIESNKRDAIEYLNQRIPADLPCEVVPLKTKYPQGAEKMLITTVLHREVPSGRLPIDTEVVVQNVGTVAAIGDLFTYGQPLIERVVTVTGPGINRPSTLLAPVGAKLTDVLNHCGGLKPNTRQVISGGPMMGIPLQTLDAPITKGASGILCLTDDQVKNYREYPCIRCASCVEACPVFLNPTEMGALSLARRWNDMLDYHIMDCIECGACSYVCPSNIPLVQRFRVGKAMLREQLARDKAAAS